jgi:hypothetical protein
MAGTLLISGAFVISKTSKFVFLLLCLAKNAK